MPGAHGTGGAPAAGQRLAARLAAGPAAANAGLTRPRSRVGFAAAAAEILQATSLQPFRMSLPSPFTLPGRRPPAPGRRLPALFALLPAGMATSLRALLPALALALNPALALAQPAGAAASAPAASSTASPAASPAEGRIWLVGPEGAALSLEQALAQAADGDIIEMMPGEYTTRLVIENRRLTFRGLRGAELATIKGDSRPMADKALWTVRGGRVLIEDLVFRGARGADGSGAGLRQEGGELVLRRCRFFDNEHALVAANDEQATITVEAGVFGMAPRVEGGLHHLVSIGRIGRFEVSGTRFQQGFEGHLLKTRARVNHIAYNFIHDGLGGGASLELDIAGGGLATVIGNIIGQGSRTQNPVVLAYGSEGPIWPENRLLLAHNTFVNHDWMPAWFLRVFRDRLPQGVELVAVNNLLAGGGVFEWGNEGLFEGNQHILRRSLADVQTHSFELPPASSLRGTGVDPRRIGGHDLAPKAEFDWRQGSVPLAEPNPARWSPGALQK